jgi:transposase-like protein
MARLRSFSFEFKRQVVLDFLEGRAELRGLARQHNLSRHVIRLWIQKCDADHPVKTLTIQASW